MESSLSFLLFFTPQTVDETPVTRSGRADTNTITPAKNDLFAKRYTDESRPSANASTVPSYSGDEHQAAVHRYGK